MRSFDTKGEREIEVFLKKMNIGYAKQERWYLDDGERYVITDFTIRPVPENSMASDFVGIIEFDGQPAHFKAFDAFGGFNRFF